MSEQDRAALDALCDSQLGISLGTLLRLVPALNRIRALLTTPLALQRFNGLMTSTTKEDPLDCTYVRKCVIEFAKHPEEFQELCTKLGFVDWLLVNDKECKDE